MVELTLSHGLYVLFIFVVIALMVMKKDVVIACLLGLFCLAFIYHKAIVPTIQSVFSGLMVAAEELLTIIMVISLMVAMLKSLNILGADYKMFRSLNKLIKGPTAAYIVLGLMMYICALFFWPTPSTALVGALLIPFAIKAGLPPMLAAVSCNIFGHGMALSGDLVIQGALKLSANAADIPVESVFRPSLILSLVSGLIAGVIAFLMYRKEIKTFANSEARRNVIIDVEEPKMHPAATFFAVAVPVIFLTVIVAMVKMEIKGGDATALLGGTGLALLFLATIVNSPKNCFSDIVKHLREGFLFGMKIFAPVIPIAAFFFLGSNDAPSILGEGAPALLFDIGGWVATQVPLNKGFLAFGLLIVGYLTGLDGSGFSGLPLTGSLAAALGTPAGVDVAALATIGQMGAIWSGGGCLTPWAFGLAATAGIAGVEAQELARKNFIPVVIGLIASTVVGIMIM
jgi:hypothetical protein